MFGYHLTSWDLAKYPYINYIPAFKMLNQATFYVIFYQLHVPYWRRSELILEVVWFRHV